MIEVYPMKDIKAGQVYTAEGGKRIEVVAIGKNGVPTCRMYGVFGVPNGNEYEASLGISKVWKLREERGTEVTTLPALESKQEIRYCLMYDDGEFDADGIIEDIKDCADFENLEEAMDSKDDDQSVIRVTIDYKFEKIPEEKPSFESELAELKKKYGKV